MAAPLLSTVGLAKAYGNRQLFAGVELSLGEGERLGLIGDNGAGKSTLLRVLAGEIAADDGQIHRRRGLRVGMLPQVPVLPPGTVRAALAAPFAALAAAIADYGSASGAAGADADDPVARIEALGGWDWEHRIEAAASGLGLADLDRPTAALSGGEAKRVALAVLVAQPPDLLFLDEPTNHLDLDTITWMETWLGRMSQAVVVVTHDRRFLESVVASMAELRGGSLRRYAGSYADYLAARATEEALAERSDARRARILAAELDWARRSPSARTTKSQSRLDRVHTGLAAQAAARSARTATPKMAALDLGQGPRLGRTILALRDLQVAPPDAAADVPPLFEPLSVELSAGERWGIVGQNGAGKTTLLRAIAGTVPPRSGEVVRGKNTVIATFDQHRSALDPERSVAATAAPAGGDSVVVGGRSVHVAGWLARFGFGSAALPMRVGQLSGGERNRLALARFLLTPANVLLLDEPTNDLDLLTMSVLEDALCDFPGCVVVVSHDRYFLDKVATGVLGLLPRPGLPAAVLRAQGGYSSYAALAAQVAPSEAARAPAPSRGAAPATPASSAPRRRPGLTQREQRSLATVESRIEAAEAALAEVDARLADPATWAGGSAGGGADLPAARARAQAAVEALYAEWEALAQRAENG